MKIAYLIDTSINTDKLHNIENIYKIPYIKCVEDEYLKVYDHEEVEALQNEQINNYIEPNTIQYKNMMEFILSKHDYLIVITQSRMESNSYMYATYAKGILGKSNIRVVEASNLENENHQIDIYDYLSKLDINFEQTKRASQH